jgi:hypothetical protein
MLVPQQEIDRMNKIFDDTLGFEVDGLNTVDDFAVEMSRELF